MFKSLSKQKEYEMFLKKKFRAADKDKQGSLDFDETKDLARVGLWSLSVYIVPSPAA